MYIHVIAILSIHFFQVYGAGGFSGLWKQLFKKDVTGDLEYNLKSNDSHRIRWDEGDWTDDSDQMLLILITLVEKNGQVTFRGN